MSKAVIDAFGAQLKGYSTAATSVRFLFDQPLPVALIKKIVKARIAENEAKLGK